VLAVVPTSNSVVLLSSAPDVAIASVNRELSRARRRGRGGVSVERSKHFATLTEAIIRSRRDFQRNSQLAINSHPKGTPLHLSLGMSVATPPRCPSPTRGSFATPIVINPKTAAARRMSLSSTPQHSVLAPPSTPMNALQHPQLTLAAVLTSTMLYVLPSTPKNQLNEVDWV